MNSAARAFRDLPTAWSPPATLHRFADVGSYNAAKHTAVAVLSVGAPVSRLYGTEVLAISPSAVDLKRASNGLVPILDSHQVSGIANVLGRLDEAHFESGKLVGTILFDNESDAGRQAESMVARGIIRGVSIGYRVDTWQVEDEDGTVIDPDRERLAWDESYVFTAKRWELLEVSLVSVPADPAAMIRSRSLDSSAAIGADGAAEILCRMRCRSRIARRSLS
jgi:HK97 family phage prohead protease